MIYLVINIHKDIARSSCRHVRGILLSRGTEPLLKPPREPGVSRLHGGPIQGPTSPETPQISRQYGSEGLKDDPQLVPQRDESLSGQLLRSVSKPTLSRDREYARLINT